jgi:hypothetical protein
MCCSFLAMLGCCSQALGVYDVLVASAILLAHAVLTNEQEVSSKIQCICILIYMLLSYSPWGAHGSVPKGGTLTNRQCISLAAQHTGQDSKAPSIIQTKNNSPPPPCLFLSSPPPSSCTTTALAPQGPCRGGGPAEARHVAAAVYGCVCLSVCGCVCLCV